MTEFPPHPRQTLVDHLFGTLRDADGRRVRAARGEARRRQMRGWDRKKDFKKARWRATPAWAKWMFGLAAGALILSILTGGVLATIAHVFEMSFADWVGDLVVTAVGGSLVAMIGAGGVTVAVEDRAAIRAILSMRVCLKCFYDLRGTPARADGCTVCPECGATWRLGTSDA